MYSPREWDENETVQFKDVILKYLRLDNVALCFEFPLIFSVNSLYYNLLDVVLSNFIFMDLLLLLPSFHPFLYGVAVVDEPSPSISVPSLCLIYSLQSQILPHTISPCLSRSSTSSLSLHLHLHSLSRHMILLPSQ